MSFRGCLVSRFFLLSRHEDAGSGACAEFIDGGRRTRLAPPPPPPRHRPPLSPSSDSSSSRLKRRAQLSARESGPRIGRQPSCYRYVSASLRSQPRELEPSSHRSESLTTRQSDYYRTFGLQCLCLC